MLSDELKEAGEYVQELNKKLNAYRQFTKENIPKLFESRKPPNDFNESSFLYIRSYDADIGIRPFSNIDFWYSPDITIAPITNTSAYTATLEAGLTYQFNCNIRNRGDLTVPSANVEFFLVNPSLGFDTRFAKRLGITSCWINSNNTVQATIQYTIPNSEVGHKCLIVRAYTYSPLDLPVDDYHLSPPFDRHVAQFNLNIIAQSSAYSFNLIHLPIAIEHISFMPMTQDQVMLLRHPFLADFKITKTASTEILRRINIELAEQNEYIKIRKEGSEFLITIEGNEGMDIKQQGKLMEAVTSALQDINAGKAKPSQFRELFWNYRKMNQPIKNTAFNTHIPDFNLEKGEAIGLQIVNTNMVTEKTKGGITLIVTG
jgi:hypothetical protein